MKKPYLILLILSVFFPAWLGVAHQGATGIVKQRMDAFKTSQKQLKSIVAAARVEDYGIIENLAKSLAEWGGKCRNISLLAAIAPLRKLPLPFGRIFQDLAVQQKVTPSLPNN